MDGQNWAYNRPVKGQSRRACARYLFHGQRLSDAADWRIWTARRGAAHENIGSRRRKVRWRQKVDLLHAGIAWSRSRIIRSDHAIPDLSRDGPLPGKTRRIDLDNAASRGWVARAIDGPILIQYRAAENRRGELRDSDILRRAGITVHRHNYVRRARSEIGRYQNINLVIV